MELQNVLITDYVHPLLMTKFRQLGFHPVYAPDIKLEVVHAVISSFHGIVINTKIKTDRTLLEKGSQLKFVARLGSGKDIIDLDAADQLGIKIITSPEGNRNAVAEHAMGMLLSLANKINQGDQEVRTFQWNREKNRGFELEGKTIGIIGFGNTGRAFAEKFESWQTSVLSYDKYKERYAEDLHFVTETNLAEIQEKADVISFHLPLTEETTHMVDKDFLAKCQKGVILLNTSRGKVMDENAVIDALKLGQVGGLCMDVFENEHLQTISVEEKGKYEVLFGFENAVFTPHVAGWTLESKRKIAEVIIDKVKSCFSL
jgi:D-3-phosphoglycerate dehydrogenase